MHRGSNFNIIGMTNYFGGGRETDPKNRGDWFFFFDRRACSHRCCARCISGSFERTVSQSRAKRTGAGVDLPTVVDACNAFRVVAVRLIQHPGLDNRFRKSGPDIGSSVSPSTIRGLTYGLEKIAFHSYRSSKIPNRLPIPTIVFLFIFPSQLSSIISLPSSDPHPS